MATASKTVMDAIITAELVVVLGFAMLVSYSGLKLREHREAMRRLKQRKRVHRLTRGRDDGTF